MVLWIGFAILTATVIAVITRPLFRGSAREGGSRQADIAVYRDQLAEIEAERARGIIDAAEAENARAEVGRRVLAAAGGEENSEEPSGDGIGERGRMRLSLASAAVIALAGAGVYLSVGAPGLPSQPHSARLSVPAKNATVAELIGKVEAELRANPEDGQGWNVLAPVYLRLQRFDEAADAYAHALRLLGESPKRLAGFAEASILANDGIVTEPSRKAYERLLETQPDFAEARFWLAVAKEQDGDRDAAAEAYRSLLASAPEDARWREIVAQRLAAVTGQRVQEPAKPKGDGKVAPQEGDRTAAADSAQIGPTPEQVEAARSMTPEQRAEFINQMVSQLAERLQQHPDDINGWVRLVRAYVMLGKKNDALAALEKARQTFPDGSEKRMALDGIAVELGLGT